MTRFRVKKIPVELISIVFWIASTLLFIIASVLTFDINTDQKVSDLFTFVSLILFSISLLTCFVSIISSIKKRRFSLLFWFNILIILVPILTLWISYSFFIPKYLFKK